MEPSVPGDAGPLGRNGFTLESVTITELTQTPLSELRSDDIFGASGRETVTTTVVQKNIAVKRKMQEEAERTAEIAREQAINVSQQNRIMSEGKAKEDEAAVKADLAKNEAIETRDLQRQANIAVERARKEQAEQAAAIGKQKVVEAAQVDKERTIEAAQVDKQITLTMKAKESAEADAQKAAALALKERADQEVITVGQVAEAERQKQVAIVAAQREAEQLKIAADVEAYRKKLEAEAVAAAQQASAEGSAQAVKIRAKAVRTYWDAVHYVATSLSVGYANIFPVTALGKAIGAVVMMVGPALSARALETEPRSEGGPDLTPVVERLDAILEEMRRR